jgi:hypothetical protein
MIKYSARAIKALAFLFRPYNDIDIYVEDTKSRNMYEVLIERILDGKANVKRIFQLGGKTEVLRACTLDQTDRTRRRLYIIDGDYDLINAIEPPDLRYLYRLNVYASENLLLAEEAVSEVAYESLTNQTREQIIPLIDYRNFINQLVEQLLPLFVVHAIVHRIAAEQNLPIHIETTNFSVFKLCVHVGKVPSLSASKVADRIEEIIHELSANYAQPRADIDRMVTETIHRLETSAHEFIHYISAKTHILPLLILHLKSKVRYSGSIEQLKVRLARHVNLNVDAGLYGAILAAAQGEL